MPGPDGEGTIYLSGFNSGMDRRRQRVAGVPGTIWTGENIQISRGGDIERPYAFVPTYTLPAGQTFGLGAVGGQIYVFGSVATPAGLPNGVQYQRLQAPGAPAMVQVIDVRAAGGSLYVIARYADGNIYHFYNGSRVTDWDAIATTNGTLATLAIHMADVVNADNNVTAIAAGDVLTITANVPGTAFTITESVTDNSVGGSDAPTITLATLQPNVVQTNETVATGTVTITGGSQLVGTNRVADVLVNGASTMLQPVDWTLSNAATANAVAAQINNKTATTGYTAVAVGAVITISAGPGTGSTPNGFSVSPTLLGSVTTTNVSMASGVTAVAAVAQIVTATLGATTYGGTDQYKLTINGVAYPSTGNASGTGLSLYVQLDRMWSTAGSLVEYCELNTFSNWSNSNASSGAGFINVSNQAEGSEPLVGIGNYIGQTAFFSRRNLQIYNLNTDATSIALAQPIDNTGALSARSILAYGTTDTFYLDETGIRSLKARDASGAAFVNDLGTAIDTFVRTNLNALPNGAIQRACAVVEPIDGRYWLAVGPYIYVFSYFPGSSISAWTYFNPGFVVSDFARAYNRLYVRSGDTIYLYGGASGTQYAAAGVMAPHVELPFACTSPPGRGEITSFDIAATGSWQIQLLVDPDNEEAQLDAGTTLNCTYGGESPGITGRFTHLGFNLTCISAGAATISNIAIYHDGDETDA